MAKKPQLPKIKLPLSSPAAVYWDLTVRPEDFSDDRVQTFGKMVYKSRTEALLSREELGEKIKMSKESVRKIENGTVQHIKKNILYKISSALDCEPHYLLGLTCTRDTTLIDAPAPTEPVSGEVVCQQNGSTSRSKPVRPFLGAIPSDGGKPIEYPSLAAAYAAGARIQAIAPIRFMDEVNPDEIYRLAYRLVSKDAEMQRYLATIARMDEQNQRLIKDIIKFVFDHGQIGE